LFCTLSLADSIIFLTLTRLVVVIIFENFSFALFTPPLGDFQVLAWRLCRIFLRGDRPFSVILCFGGCAQAHPPGVAPEASEEWFDSSEVLTLSVMLRPALLFPHTAWP
jgi:hypothetical protein